jgi:hypothetical protein
MFLLTFQKSEIFFITFDVIISNRMSSVFFYIAGAFALMWGIAHLFPTKSVVKNFGDISADNKQIITMEWIIEGVSLIFIGALTITITIIDRSSFLARILYFSSLEC